MTTTIDTILDEFREAATSKRDMGDKFERLIAGYLIADPLYADRFEDVWLWTEWPDHGKQPDTGIDLVAKERATGEYCAIQCKFYSPDGSIQLDDISTFFTRLGKTFPTKEGKGRFSSGLIVSTTDRWSSHAEEALQDQHIPVTRLRVQDLADSPVDWSKFSLKRPDVVALRKKKSLRAHQTEALDAVIAGFRKSDRGKLIMACGTGKTFTSLKIAERLAPSGGFVLFLVPSISLMSQSLREWTAEAESTLYNIAVCSDTKVGKRSENEDISAHDLAFPATTDVKALAKQLVGLGQRSKKSTTKGKRLTIVFSTYQSIAVVAAGQKGELPEFDLIICDEAHRTTGVTLEGQDESHFVRVHDQKYLKGKKRLYMTATPRIYSDAVQTQAKEANAELCSMDNQTMYGPEFHRLGFSESISRDLLADYKVMVLAVDEKYVSKAFQSQLSDKNNELNLEDATKIAGCWNGLSKRLAREAGAEGFDSDPAPMHRAVAFSRSIKDSKRFTTQFVRIVEDYQKEHSDEEGLLGVEVEHVDGTFNALLRNQKLDWLKEEMYSGPNICRVLSNARCLSEGVDVPALDAVMFLNPRNSIVDVVQSVGRVMRKSPGKKYGYIILPIGIPADVSPEEALKDNQKYKVVWQVLQALRAHDDRFNATINQLELNKHRPDQIQVIGVSGQFGDDDAVGTDHSETGQYLLQLPYIEEWRDAIYARIVAKCGDRRYWESWATDVATIAERQVTRLKTLLQSKGTAGEAFAEFLSGLQDNINPTIDEDQAVEMLAQHLITRPVFDALFEHYTFTRQNPVSIAMQRILDIVDAHAFDKDAESLRAFYESVRRRVQGIDNAEGRQRVVHELYDTFFRLAFPRMAERLGIVYTPVELVDFILKSADVVSRQHFGIGLSDRNVHVLDPFTGTGTFIVRLLQSGLIRPEDLERKYTNELHANEIVLLAYYIAAVNIEETYHGAAGSSYEPFDGIVLTDTFQLTESDKSKGFGEKMFPDNNKRAARQKGLDIRVIVGNPPYSALQESENDNNKNLKYKSLDERIRRTYAARSDATLLSSLYDSYIRAIRWASDRIQDRGIVCFVTNGSFIDGRAATGLRLSLIEEFSRIYVLNLRGNQRTSGETSRREGGKIFGSGSRATVAITLLIKNHEQARDGVILYHDIGDYLSREEKLAILRTAGSIENIEWRRLVPNLNGDWINQRDPKFDSFVSLAGGMEREGLAVFDTYSGGVKTNRDAWMYSYSRHRLTKNTTKMVSAYNTEAKRYIGACDGIPANQWPKPESVVDLDPTKISWSSSLLPRIARGWKAKFEPAAVVSGLYRPFAKQFHYLDDMLNDRPGKIPRYFPTDAAKNRLIYVSGIGASKEFSVLITDCPPNYHALDTGQGFPLYYYDNSPGDDLLEPKEYLGWRRRDAISDGALAAFRANYTVAAQSPSATVPDIGKEDLFYYVYGIMHSIEYRTRFAIDLKKQLPRVPYASDFWAFSEAGRELANWHLNYEDVDPYPLREEGRELALEPVSHYRVEKMIFGKIGKAMDKTVIHYNSRVTLRGIPLEAYEYVLNGKSAIEWIMERYQITKDKDSQIVNDPNDWCTEHNDAKYIVNLVKRIVRVSLETMKIVKGLPALQLEGAGSNNVNAVLATALMGQAESEVARLRKNGWTQDDFALALKDLLQPREE
jgi:predicted helicase